MNSKVATLLIAVVLLTSKSLGAQIPNEIQSDISTNAAFRLTGNAIEPVLVRDQAHDEDTDHDHGKLGMKPFCPAGYKTSWFGKRCHFKGTLKKIENPTTSPSCTKNYIYKKSIGKCIKTGSGPGPLFTKPVCPKMFSFKLSLCYKECPRFFIPVLGGRVCAQLRLVKPICKKGYHLDPDFMCYEDSHDHDAVHHKHHDHDHDDDHDH